MTIIPSSEVWARVDKAFALGAYHWFFFAQPYDLPEHLTPAKNHVSLLHVSNLVFGHTELFQDLLVVLAPKGECSRGGQFGNAENPRVARHP